jgi:hypothetical protein
LRAHAASYLNAEHSSLGGIRGKRHDKEAEGPSNGSRYAWKFLPPAAMITTLVDPFHTDASCRRKIEMSSGAQSRDDTSVGGVHDERDPGLHPCSESRAAHLIASLDQDWATIVGDW